MRRLVRLLVAVWNSPYTPTTNHEKSMQTKNDTPKPEDSPEQETGEGCPEASCASSDTPETDAAWDESCPLKKLSDAEKKDFAAKLERERNALACPP